MKKVNILIFIVLVGVIAWLSLSKDKEKPMLKIMSFKDCVKAGYPVMESLPRQCKTPDGRTYAEEIAPPITYNNTDADHIVVDLPFPGAVVGKEFKVTGKARGFYFEASFPVEVLDKDGKQLFIGPAQAIGDWMVDAFVPFSIDVKLPESYIGPATLILRKDNPSDMRQYDGSISFPITIEY
jgi:hypothetical protein